MTHKEFTASISVHEDWIDTDKDIQEALGDLHPSSSFTLDDWEE